MGSSWGSQKFRSGEIEAVSFLGKQNIPFRGHREDRSDLCNNSDQNRGNFLELISLLSKDNVTVNKKLSADRKWLHSDIQNELIEIIASHTVTKIVKEMKHENHSEGTPFSLICDETSDTSRHEQFSLCASYVGSSGMKTETFICFIKVEQTDAASLYNVVCSSLCQ